MTKRVAQLDRGPSAGLDLEEEASMRIGWSVVVPVSLALTGCTSPERAKVTELEARVAALEVAVAASSSKSASADASAFAHGVRIELGDTELYDGDLITIEEVRGTAPTIRPGGIYLVRGKYHLASRGSARLLASVTETTKQSPPSDSSAGTLAVSRGEGSFSLVFSASGAGYPHVTFYDDEGRPFGGVYFGAGESLLADKRWRYRGP